MADNLEVGGGLDLNLALNVTDPVNFVIGPWAGPYVEYHFDNPNIAIGLNTRFGVVIPTATELLGSLRLHRPGLRGLPALLTVLVHLAAPRPRDGRSRRLSGDGVPRLRRLHPVHLGTPPSRSPGGAGRRRRRSRWPPCPPRAPSRRPGRAPGPPTRAKPDSAPSSRAGPSAHRHVGELGGRGPDGVEAEGEARAPPASGPAGRRAPRRASPRRRPGCPGWRAGRGRARPRPPPASNDERVGGPRAPSTAPRCRRSRRSPCGGGAAASRRGTSARVSRAVSSRAPLLRRGDAHPEERLRGARLVPPARACGRPGGGLDRLRLPRLARALPAAELALDGVPHLGVRLHAAHHDERGALGPEARLGPGVDLRRGHRAHGLLGGARAERAPREEAGEERLLPERRPVASALYGEGADVARPSSARAGR